VPGRFQRAWNSRIFLLLADLITLTVCIRSEVLVEGVDVDDEDSQSIGLHELFQLLNPFSLIHLHARSLVVDVPEMFDG
jgi:hypothetical protein